MAYSILIIKIAALGDVLRTSFLLKGLKKKYEGCSISWLTSKRAKELLINNPLIDKIYTLDEDLSDEKFDLVLSLDEEKEAGQIATDLKKDKLIGVCIEDEKIVYTDNSSDWFGMGLFRPESKGGIEEANRLKKSNKKTFQEIMGKIVGVNYGNEKPMLVLSENDLKFGKEFVKNHGINDNEIVIGLNTGAGKRWKLKKWSVDKTVELADLLNNELNAKVILLGGEQERERNKKIIRLSKGDIIDSGTENTLREFISIINRCTLIVSSDTLALHIGTALNKKVIVLIGPTSAAEIELFGSGEKICGNIDCLCCYKKKCDKEDSCMEKISVEIVYDAIKRQRK